MFAHLLRRRRSAPRSLRVPGKPFRPSLETFEDRCVPARVFWSATGGGNFGDAANWTVENSSPPVHVVPGPADDAVIGRAGIVVTANGPLTVRSLSFPAGGEGTRFQIAGGTFTVTSSSVIGEVGLTQGAALQVNGGTTLLIYGATLAGRVTAAAGATVEFGTRADLNEGVQLTGPGRFAAVGGYNSTVTANAAVSLANLSILNGSRLNGPAPLTVTNQLDWVAGSMLGTGTTVVAAGATLNLSSSAIHGLERTLDNRGTVRMTGNALGGGGVVLNSGTWDIQTDVVIAGTAFRNTGTLVKSGGIRDSVFNVRLENQGNVQLRLGTLQVNRGGTGAGSFGLTDGTLHVAAGTFTLGPGSSVGGAGLLRVGGETAGAALHVDLSLAVPALSLEPNGSVAGSGTLTVTRFLDWSGGAMTGAGVTRVASDAVWSLNTPPVRTLGRTFELAGYGVWTDGDLTLTDNAVLRIQPTGYLDAQHFDARSVGGTGAVRNAGVFFKGGDGRTTLGDGVQLYNDGGYVGIYDGIVETARAYIQNDGVTEMVVGSTLRAAEGVDLRAGYLFGSGTIVGNVTNNAWIEVGGWGYSGLLRVQGNYRQTAAGVLSLELGGPIPGDESDQLDVTGTATLDGLLLVGLVPDYQPNPGDVFEVLRWSARQGQFATVMLPDGVSASYGAGGLSLTMGPR